MSYSFIITITQKTHNNSLDEKTLQSDIEIVKDDVIKWNINKYGKIKEQLEYKKNGHCHIFKGSFNMYEYNNEYSFTMSLLTCSTISYYFFEHNRNKISFETEFRIESVPEDNKI